MFICSVCVFPSWHGCKTCHLGRGEILAFIFDFEGWVRDVISIGFQLKIEIVTPLI